MKNISKIMLCALCLCLTLACSDEFLQEKRDFTRMIPEDIYKDPVQANAVFSTIYKRILERLANPLYGADALMRQGRPEAGGSNYYLTDETPYKYPSSANNILEDGRYRPSNDKNTKAGNAFPNPPYWNAPRDSPTSYNNPSQYTLFPNIYLVNELLSQIELVGRSSYDNKTFWDQLRGQALFVRAWLYYDAVRFFGGVPYYNTETDMAQPGDRSPRMSVQDCIDRVCADFEAAAELLPAKWDAENEGRFTSVAAKAMISRARLAVASPVFNASWESGTVRWQAALDAALAAEQAANTAGYGTSVTSIDSWDRAFYSYAGTSFNPEAIIKVPKSDVSTLGIFNGWEAIIRPGFVRGGGSQAGLPAPEQMILAFPMKDGRRATVDNGYDEEKFWRDRDPRFYRTIAFSGCEWPGTSTRMWLYAYKFSTATAGDHRYTDSSQNDDGTSRKSRAVVWKMSDPTVAVSSENTVGTDILEYRYAEILLNVAECYAALGNTGQAADYLNKIRARVGAGNVPALADKYAAIEAVLYERLAELAYEGKRPWDLRRWLLYEGGAGFDPRLVAATIDDDLYDPEEAWGLGWKLYNGKDGRPEYTKNNNVLTKLRLPRISGTPWHTSKIWAYDLGNVYPVEPNTTGNPTHPLINHPDLLAVPPIKRDMDEASRNAAFDKLETFYTNAGLVTIDPKTDLSPQFKYGMNSGTSNANKNYRFSWRGWYCLWPIHYDAYTAGKGNDWLEQNEGWMTANANPIDKNSEQQNGKYIYCTPE
jgi:hypothetical protein